MAKKTPKPSPAKRAAKTPAVAEKKKKAPAKTATIPNASSIFMAIYNEWRNGAQISTLAETHKMKRSKLRRQLIQHAGGKEKFRELRSAGAGGSAEPFGGKRAEPRTRESIALDDSKVRRVDSSERKASWTHEWERGSHGSFPVPIDPDGQRYVRAGATEKADVIFTSSTAGIPDARYRVERGSGVSRAERKASEQIERGEALLAKKTERSKIRKENRKKR